MRAFLQIFLVVMISVSIVSSNSARADDSGSSSTSMTGTRKQLATIIFAGLGGAVLGLSTLSFYGRPQDYMANIAIGFAVGVIVGTVIVTFRAASNPNEFNNSSWLEDGPEGSALTSISDKNSREFGDSLTQSRTTPTVQLGWNF